MITFSPLFLKKAGGISIVVPPVYELTEAPIFFDSFYWVENSAVGLTTGNGKLYTNLDTSWSSAEVTARYPEDGTIDLSGGYYINTGWVAPQNSEWSISGIYNVVMGVSYSMYAIHYHGNQTCDVYLYDYVPDTDFPTVPTYTNVPYTPPAGNWEVHEEPPSVLAPDIIEYTMGVFNVV